jgi:hypothetical protein
MQLETLAGGFEKIYPIELNQNSNNSPGNLHSITRRRDLYKEITTLSNFTEKMTSVRMIKKFEEEKAQEKERKAQE